MAIESLLHTVSEPISYRGEILQEKLRASSTISKSRVDGDVWALGINRMQLTGLPDLSSASKSASTTPLEKNADDEPQRPTGVQKGMCPQR